MEPVGQRVTVEFAGRFVADSAGAVRVLETSHPPTVYVPPGDLDGDLLRAAGGASLCEWKGTAAYVDLVVGDAVSERAGWSYRSPVPAFAELKDFVAFYPSRVDRCTIGGEVVQAQEGDFYGGWITSNLVGPFKGPPGTRGW
jgi:uncharacterized protein (DUF427 family)